MKGLSRLVVVLITIMSFGLASRATALPLTGDNHIDFGMVGITFGQTVRLNTVNVGNTECTVDLVFLDKNSHVLATFTVTVAPNNAAFNDLNRDQIVGYPESRVQVRAVMLRNPNETSPCKLVPTLEVFNNEDGRTTLFFSNPEVNAGLLNLDDLL